MKKQEKEPFLDRVLLHSKNADERLFDMVLRFITFVILIIIIWIYVDLVHVKADGVGGVTIGEIYRIDFSKLPVSNVNSLLWRSDEYAILLDEYTDISYNSNYHPNYITTGYTTNMIVPSELYMDNSYIFYCYASSNLDGFYTYCIDRELIDSGRVIYTPSGFYSSEDFTYYTGSKWSGSVYALGAQTFDHTLGVHHLSNDQYCSTANCYFSNCPCWTGTRLDVNVIGGPINWEQIKNDVSNINFTQSAALFNCNYFLYDHIMSQTWDTNQESNQNHMYLKDFNIGFTSSNNMLDSNLVISAKWDEWIETHLTEYQMKITYDFYYNGEPYAIWENNDYHQNPVSGTYTEYVPLGKFSSYYAPEFRTITNHVGVSNDSLEKILDAFYSAGMQYETEQTSIQDVLNGMDAKFAVEKDSITNGVVLNVGVLYNYLHPFRENSEGETLVGDRVVYMTDFDFVVTLQLVSNDGYESGLGGRSWDFLQGTSSMNYDILQNNNKFMGSAFEGYANTGDVNNINNSNIAYGGNAQGGSANISNITISGGNGYQDTELHRLTDQDIAHNHQKIITVIEDLKYCFHQFAQENNHNSFIQMIYDDYNYIPGIEYITTSIIIICGVCVLIFIIKIAF